MQIESPWDTASPALALPRFRHAATDLAGLEHRNSTLEYIRAGYQFWTVEYIYSYGRAGDVQDQCSRR